MKLIILITSDVSLCGRPPYYYLIGHYYYMMPILNRMVCFSNNLKYGAVFRVCFRAIGLKFWTNVHSTARYLVFECFCLTLRNFVGIVIYHPKNTKTVIWPTPFLLFVCLFNFFPVNKIQISYRKGYNVTMIYRCSNRIRS